MDSLGQFLPHTDGQAECGVWGEPDSPRCFWLLCRDTRHLRKLLLLPGPSLEGHAWQRPVRLSLTWRLQPASGPTGSPVWGLLGACPRASALPRLWALCHSTCQSVRKAPAQQLSECLIPLLPAAVTLRASAGLGHRQEPRNVRFVLAVATCFRVVLGQATSSVMPRPALWFLL